MHTFTSLQKFHDRLLLFNTGVTDLNKVGRDKEGTKEALSWRSSIKTWSGGISPEAVKETRKLSRES